jgi:hypothetical protein
MRSPVLVLALTFGLACGGYAFAADEAPQPLTRADCDAAGMTWNDGTNVCGSADTVAAAQPLTRADCEAAGMTWDDGANVCGAGATAAAQPLTRADCEAAGMKWSDRRNVCGAFVAAAAAHAHKKEMKKETKNGGTKIVKKVKTSHGVKKTVIHKKGHKHETAAKKGGFLEWLNGKKKKS